MHTLGHTGLAVTRLGLGLAARGRPRDINLGPHDDKDAGRSVEAMEARCHAMLDHAWARGIRYFDAARSYGRAEEFLAHWLDARGLAPTVGSKWGYTYTADWQVDAPAHEIKEHSLAVLQRQWRESRDWFGARLKLYQIHSATLDSGVLDNTEVLTELARIRDSGVAIGFTTSGPAQAAIIDKALAVEVDGVRLFDCVQSTWNLLEPSAGDALHTAHDSGLGVIIKEAVANGRLTSRNDRAAFAQKRARLAMAAQAHGVGIDAIAIAAVLAQPWVDVVLSGAASAQQLDANLKALEISLDADALIDELAEAPQDYWQTRAALAWN